MLDEELDDEKCQQIVEDAIRLGLLVRMCSGGCGRTYDNCGGCPCGWYLDWHPKALNAVSPP